MSGDELLLPVASSLDGTEVFRAVRSSGAAIQVPVLAVQAGIDDIIATGSTTSRTLAARFADVVNVKDFGALGDAVTDDTVAINAAYAATATAGCLYFPAGDYRHATALVFDLAKRIAFIGEGVRQTRLVYNGASTTANCVTFGDGTTSEQGLRIEGIGFSSNVIMTAGCGVRFRKVVRSHLTNVYFGHQDGNGNYYHAVWFDGFDFVTLDQFQARASQDGIRISGNSVKADLLLTGGKIASCTIGLHIAGDAGGVCVDMTDIINNGTNVRISQDIVATANRETFFGPTALIDSGDAAGGVTFDGIGVDIADTDGFVSFAGGWLASAGALINVGSTFGGRLLVNGVTFYNAFARGVHSGNAIQIASSTAKVSVTGSRFYNVEGTAITYSGAGTLATHMSGNYFHSDVTANLSAVSSNALTYSSELYAGTITKYNVSAFGQPVTQAAGTADYTAGAAYSAWVASNRGGTIQFLKSRGASVGTRAIVQSGDEIARLMFAGDNGTSFERAAQIVVTVDGTPGASGDMPGKISLATSADGSASPTARLDLDSAGNIGINGTSFGSGVKVLFIGNGTAPSGSPTAGGILYVESGALKFKGSSGTVTTIGPA